MTTHYDTLGIDPQSDQAAVKRGYRAAAQAAHPDTGGDEETMKRVNAAYSCLSDPERRRLYDATGCDEQAMDARASYEQTLATLFRQCVEAQVQPHEVLGKLKRDITARMKSENDRLPQLEARRDQLKRYREAIVGTELFSAVVDSMVDAANLDIETTRAVVKQGEGMLEILKEYRCGVKKPARESQQFAAFQWTVDPRSGVY